MRLRFPLTLVSIAAVTLLSGCAAVAGSATTEPGVVAAYQSQVARAVLLDACDAWAVAANPRVDASIAAGEAVNDPAKPWAESEGVVMDEAAAVDVELEALAATVASAERNPGLHTLLLNYQNALSAYGDALRGDIANNGTSWAASNDALDVLQGALRELNDMCFE